MGIADKREKNVRSFANKHLEEIHCDENLEIEKDVFDAGWNTFDEEEDQSLDQLDNPGTSGQHVLYINACYSGVQKVLKEF